MANEQKVHQLKNALARENTKLTRQLEAVEATKGLIDLIESQIKALSK